ncbi:unnamed protein product [Paramecium primaurelia]|uniref:Uncharacterized protein n=1 Tax=Paramecium primaurelia TaxID=5886 RepID=A0A8S1MA77_PARPR|nr:unnamed protein product [Paramecium primaurelia]
MRTTPNSVKETASKASTQDYKKQQSQPTVSIPESSQLFHIPQKYCQQRFKPQPTISKSIEEKRYKSNKNNFSEINNRTNSSSKSRISAFTSNQIEDESMYSSQNALKLKKLIGDSQTLNTHLYISKSNLTCDSTSPGVRQNKSGYKKQNDLDIAQINMLREKTLMQKRAYQLQFSQSKELMEQLMNLDKQIQGTVQEQQKKLLYLKSRGLWEPFKDLFNKQFARTSLQYKSSLNLLQIQVREIEQQWQDVTMNITNNIFELMQNSAVLMSYEQDLKLNEMIEQMRRERDIWQNNYKSLEQERDILLETVSQLKQTLEKIKPQQQQQQQTKKPKDLDQLETHQLKEMAQLMQDKIQEMSDKESKLIKLVLAIKRSGIDIEKIYNEEVLNEDSISEQQNHSIRDKKQMITKLEKSFNDADNSVVNDSDESSFQYNGRLDDESIVESIRRFENRIQNNTYAQESKSSVRMKIDLSKCNQHQQKIQQLQQLQQQQLIKKQQQQQQNNINKLKIPEQDPQGFHQEFMMKFNEFSESWRLQVLKDEKKINQ